MPKFDRQIIIVLLAGDAQDASVMAQARAMNEKERAEALDSEVVTARPGVPTTGTFATADLEEIRQAMAGRLKVLRPITQNSRVYLVGSGNWRRRRLAAWSPEEVADLLGQVEMPAVKVISIVADGLGRSVSATGKPVRPECLDSFAAVFHRRLKEVWRIRTVVHARVLKVAVVFPGRDGQPLAGVPAPRAESNGTGRGNPGRSAFAGSSPSYKQGENLLGGGRTAGGVGLLRSPHSPTGHVTFLYCQDRPLGYPPRCTIL